MEKHLHRFYTKENKYEQTIIFDNPNYGYNLCDANYIFRTTMQ